MILLTRISNTLMNIFVQWITTCVEGCICLKDSGMVLSMHDLEGQIDVGQE